MPSTVSTAKTQTKNSLAGKVVVLTGASLGIGKETAFLFAKEKCKLVLTYYKDKAEMEKVVTTCKELGAADVLSVKFDSTQEKEILNLVAQTKQKFGSVDILINNAGIITWKLFHEQSLQEIDQMVQTNLVGTIKTTHAFLPLVKETIINLASAAGLNGYPQLAVYCATKFGVRGFTQALAAEHPELRIYAINPDVTATRMNDFRGRPPSDVAKVIFNTAKGVYPYSSGEDVNVWDALGEEEN
jgi:3-oxoacyl-[acyl-carrier protein] reductase